jgi:hypothetical protein
MLQASLYKMISFRCCWVLLVLLSATAGDLARECDRFRATLFMSQQHRPLNPGPTVLNI